VKVGDGRRPETKEGRKMKQAEKIAKLGYEDLEQRVAPMTTWFCSDYVQGGSLSRGHLEAEISKEIKGDLGFNK